MESQHYSYRYNAHIRSDSCISKNQAVMGRDMCEGTSGVSLPSRASNTRLRRLQRLCSRGGIDSSPEALLFIGGADGRFNASSQSVIKFLFLGTTGRDLHNSEIGLEYEAIEDCVLLIGRHEVSILYSEAAAIHILPLVAAWPHCKEYMISSTDVDDTDIIEDQKVWAFREMIRSTLHQGSSVGTPFPRGSQDFRDVEMSPLIQSFAVDNGDGSGSFFTMEYDVRDVRNVLPTVFGSIDALVVRNCLLRGSSILAHHLSAMHEVLNMARHGVNRLSLSEADLVSPLQLLHDSGVMQETNGDMLSGEKAHKAILGPGVSQHGSVSTMIPRVLLGLRTAIIDDWGAWASTEHTIGNSGARREMGYKPATHFIVEAGEPSTGLCICRTAFLGTMEDEILALISAYRRLCLILPQVVSDMSRGPSPLFVPGRRMITPRECEQCALDSVRNIVPVLNSAKTSEMWEAKAVVQATDACHVPIPQDHPLHGTRGHEGCLIYVRLSLFGRLGAVAVGDTYAVLSPAEEMDSGQSPLLLTGPGCSPYVVVWSCPEGDEEEETCKLLHNLRDRSQLAGPLGLGVPLSCDLGSTTDEAPATALFVDLQLPYIDGKLRLFSEGLVFRAPGRAPIVVSMRPSTASPAPSTMTLVGITEIPSQDNIFLLLIKFQGGSASSNPLATVFPFLSSTDAFAIPLGGESSLLQDVLKAFGSWKTVSVDCMRSLGSCDIPSDILINIGNVVMTVENAGERASRVAGATAARLSRVAADVDVALLTMEYQIANELGRDRAPNVVHRGHETSPRDDEDAGMFFPVTLLLGLPGSGVLSAAATILQFSSAEIRWKLVMFTPSRPGIDEIELGRAIELAVGPSSMTARSRILLVVSAEVGAAAVCSILSRWTQRGRGLTIQACTVCMGVADSIPGSGGGERWRSFLVDQCTAGFISNVLLLGKTASIRSWEGALELRRRLYLANPGLQFLYSCSLTHLDPEVLESILTNGEFESLSMLQMRHETLGPKWPTLRLPCTRGSDGSDSGEAFPHPPKDAPLFSAPRTLELATAPPLAPSPGIVARTSRRVEKGIGIQDVDGRGRIINSSGGSRELRGLGIMEKWKLLKCMRALFPVARVETAGVEDEDEDEDELGTQREVMRGGIVRDGHDQGVRVLDSNIRQWARQETAREGSESSAVQGKAHLKTPSIVGLVKLRGCNASHEQDDDTFAVVEAIPENILLSKIPADAVHGFRREGSGQTSVMVIRARSQARVHAIEKLLQLASRPLKLVPLEVRTRSDLSAEELDGLRKEHIDDPLPTGWFFDGSVFVDFDGNRRQDRPGEWD